MSFEVLIASHHENDSLVSEIWHNNEQFAEVSNNGEKLKIDIFPRENGHFWEFDLDELINAIEASKSNMLPTSG
jgi:hypothetical protein